jgi:Transposase DDE domain
MEREGFDPHIATGRQRHNTVPTTATADPASTPAPPEEKTAKEKMRAKLDTESGRALSARRKTIVEPVFGQIKETRGFRRFLLRGLLKIGGKWRLVCLTHNLLKIWRYGSGIVRRSHCDLIN